MLFISGQIPINPKSGKMVEADINIQTKQVLQNIGSILEEAGYRYEQVVKTTCLLTDMDNFKEMNDIYASYFKIEQPARAAFAVKELPLGALIEIEAIAVKSTVR